jgi:hypothetical protein
MQGGCDTFNRRSAAYSYYSTMGAQRYAVTIAASHALATRAGRSPRCSDAVRYRAAVIRSIDRRSAAYSLWTTLGAMRYAATLAALHCQLSLRVPDPLVVRIHSCCCRSGSPVASGLWAAWSCSTDLFR